MKTIIISFTLILALASFGFCDIFKPRVDYYIGRDCFDLAVGDLNNDGKNDVAVGNDSYNWIRVYYQGLNSLETYVDYNNDYMVLPYCPVIGDINKDGLNDLVVIGAGTIFIWLQNEFNTLEHNQKINMGASNVRAGVLADLDLDGDLDIITSLYSTNEVGIFWQTSLLVFTKETLSADNSPFGIGILDVNLDGYKDIVVANYLGATLNVFQQDPIHNFSKSIINFNLDPSHHFIQIAVGDLSGDGKDDLIVSSTSGQGQVYSYISSKSGLIASDIYDVYAAWAVDIGDVNNDRKNDVVVGAGSDIYVYLKDGSALTLTSLGNIRDVAIEDVNNDGLNDILSTSDYTNKAISVFVQDGSYDLTNMTGYWEGKYKWTSPGWSATWPIGLGIHVSPQGRVTGVIGVYTLGNYGEWSYQVSGRVTGNKIEFVYKGTTHNHLFEGTIDGSTIKGNFERSDGQYGIFEINKYTKNPDDLRLQTGYWEGSYNWDSVGNDTWPVGLGIDINRNGVITGVIGIYTKGYYGTLTYKTTGKLIGNKIEFSYRYRSYSYTFTGKMAGIHIRGTWKRSDGHYGNFQLKRYIPSKKVFIPDDYPVKLSKIRFLYNFNDRNLNGWTPNAPAYSVFGGSVRLKGRLRNSSYLLYNENFSWLKPFRIDVSLKFTELKDASSARMGVRFRDSETGQYVGVYLGNEPYSSGANPNGKVVEICKGETVYKTASYNWNVEWFYNLTFIVQDGRIYVYVKKESTNSIGDRPILTGTIDSNAIRSGRLDLFTFSASAEFDYIILSDLERKDFTKRPTVSVKMLHVPNQIKHGQQCIIRWKLEGDVSEVEQTDILWGLKKGEYIYSGQSFSSDKQVFKDTLEIPEELSNNAREFYIYVIGRAIIGDKDFYSPERKIKVLCTKNNKK